MPVAKTQPNAFLAKRSERVVAGRVQREERSHERTGRRIDLFRLASTPIEVASRRRKRIDSLLQPTANALKCLFAEIANVVRSDYSLDVGRQPSPASAKVKCFVSEMDVNARVNKIAEIVPITQI